MGRTSRLAARSPAKTTARSPAKTIARIAVLTVLGTALLAGCHRTVSPDLPVLQPARQDVVDTDVTLDLEALQCGGVYTIAYGAGMSLDLRRQALCANAEALARALFARVGTGDAAPGAPSLTPRLIDAVHKYGM